MPAAGAGIQARTKADDGSMRLGGRLLTPRPPARLPGELTCHLLLEPRRDDGFGPTGCLAKAHRRREVASADQLLQRTVRNAEQRHDLLFAH